MLSCSMDIVTMFPVRKSKKQKQGFRDAVQSYCERLGYAVSVEKGSCGSRNLIIGDPHNAKYLVTAHYDTCARLPFPNLITPCKVLPFVLYQLFQVLYIFAGAWLPGVLIGILTSSPKIGGLIGGVMTYVLIICMLVGPANRHNANDNTSGIVTVLEIARTMPENLRNRVAFVLFDLEEAGMIGSASYQKAHKSETTHQTVLNLDCVGDGNEIIFFPTAKLRKDGETLVWLYKVIGRYGEKTIDVREKGFVFYPSDHTQFPCGVGIGAFHRSKWAGPYYSRIHTPKDTVLDETNVNILRAALTTLICQ